MSQKDPSTIAIPRPVLNELRIRADVAARALVNAIYEVGAEESEPAGMLRTARDNVLFIARALQPFYLEGLNEGDGRDPYTDF